MSSLPEQTATTELGIVQLKKEGRAAILLCRNRIALADSQLRSLDGLIAALDDEFVDRVSLEVTLQPALNLVSNYLAAASVDLLTTGDPGHKP